MPSSAITQSRVNLLEDGLKRLRNSNLMNEMEFKAMYLAIDRHHSDIKLAHLTGKPKDLLQQAQQDTQFFYILVKMLSEVTSSKKTEQKSYLQHVHDWYTSNRHVLYSGPHFGKEPQQGSGFTTTPRTPKSGKSSARTRESSSRPRSRLKFLKTDDDFEDIFNDERPLTRVSTARPKSAPEFIHRKRGNLPLSLNTSDAPYNSPLISPGTSERFDHGTSDQTDPHKTSEHISVTVPAAKDARRGEPCEDPVLPKRQVHSLSSLVNPHAHTGSQPDLTADLIKVKPGGPLVREQVNQPIISQGVDKRSEHLRKWDEYQQEINYGQDILAHLQHIGRTGTAHGVRYVAHETAQMPEFYTRDIISNYINVADEEDRQSKINQEPIILNQSLEEFYETANGYYPSKLPKYPSFKSRSVPGSRNSSRKNSARARSENKENIAHDRSGITTPTNSIDDPSTVDPKLKLDIVVNLVNTVTEDMLNYKEKLAPEPAPGFKQPVIDVEPAKPRPHTAPPGDCGKHYANIHLDGDIRDYNLINSVENLYNSQPLKDPHLNRTAVTETVDWRGKVTPNTTRYKWSKTGFGGHTYVKSLRPHTPKQRSLRSQGCTSAGSRPRTAPMTIKEKWRTENLSEDNQRTDTAASHTTTEVDPEVVDGLFQVQHFDSNRKKPRSRFRKRNIISLEREIARNFYGSEPAEPSLEYLTLCAPKSVLTSRESTAMTEKSGGHSSFDEGYEHFSTPFVDMPYNMEWGQSGDMMFDSGLYANLDKDLLDSASLSADLEKRSLNDLTEMEETEAEEEEINGVSWAEKEIQVEMETKEGTVKENINVDLTQLGSTTESSTQPENQVNDKTRTINQNGELKDLNGDVKFPVEKEVKFAEPEKPIEPVDESTTGEIQIAGMKFSTNKTAPPAGQKSNLTKSQPSSRQSLPVSVTPWQPFTEQEPTIVSKNFIQKQSLVKPGRLSSSAKHDTSTHKTLMSKPHRSILKIEYQPPVESVLTTSHSFEADLTLMPYPPKPRGASPPRAYSAKADKAATRTRQPREPKHHPLSMPRRTPPSIPSAQTPYGVRASPRTGPVYMAEAESHARKINSPRSYMKKVGGIVRQSFSESVSPPDAHAVQEELLSSVSVLKLSVESKNSSRPNTSPEQKTRNIYIYTNNGYQTPPPSQQDTESLSSKRRSPVVPHSGQSSRPIPDYVDVQDPEKYSNAMQIQNEAKAAVNIQRYFRGYVGRNYYKRILKEKREKIEDERKAAIQIQKTLRGHLSRKKAIYSRKPNSETLEWARDYKVLLIKRGLERQDKMESLTRENTMNQLKANAKISVIGPHVEIYQNFHPKLSGPDKWMIQKSAVVIQKWVRGWLVRRCFERLHRKSKMHSSSWLRFVTQYKDLLRRIQSRHGIEKPKTPFNIEEVIEYMDVRRRYESVFDKKAFGNEIDLSELASYFKECDLYPAQPEIDEAVDAVFRGQPLKSGRGLTKNEVMEITFQLYVPRATGLTDLRKSTWMNPIVDGEEAIKLLGTEAVEETDFKTCWKLCADAKKEQKAKKMTNKD